jgi:hypothetical protein
MLRKPMYNRIATAAVKGMVSIQLHAMVNMRDHLTLFNLKALPTPMTELLITCVVLTGAPIAFEKRRTVTDAMWDASECIGRTRKISNPTVLIIFVPPRAIPAVRATILTNFIHGST